MKIGNEVARGARHGDGGAPAQMIRVKKSSRAIIGTNPSEPGNCGNTVFFPGSSGVLQIAASFRYPDSRITVGLSEPRHSRYILRPSPIATRPAKSPVVGTGALLCGATCGAD